MLTPFLFVLYLKHVYIMLRIAKDKVPGNSGVLCELVQSLLRTTHEYVLAVGDAIGYSGSQV